jgi:hypothetical protein
VTLRAPDEPGLVVIEASATQGPASCLAESLVTVTDSIVPEEAGKEATGGGKGLPGYTFVRAPAELWRSRYDDRNNLVVINSGHRDFVYAAQKHARRLRYVCRLFAKELVLRNFQGFEREALLEHLIELSLYTEEHLK